LKMTKYILENKVVYDSVSHSLLLLGMRNTQVALAIPASLCLLVLLQNKDEIVSLEQLLSFAWASRGMNVSSNTIYQNISILRKSLVSFGLSPDIIKTIPKRGFVVLSESFSEFLSPPETEGGTGISSATSDMQFKKTIITPEMTFTRVIFILTLTMLCILSFFGVYKLTIYTEDYGSGYIYPAFTEVHQDSDCHIYRNKSVLNDRFFERFMASHGLKCGVQKWWYIFNYPPAAQTFVLRCSSDLLSIKNSNDIYCISDYYF